MLEAAANEIFDLLLRFNRQLGFARLRHPTPLTVNEAHVITEASYSQRTSVITLSSSLGLEKSTVSRLVGALIKRKLLRIETSATDGRLKPIKPTKQGLETLDHDSSVRNLQILDCIEPLSNTEQEELGELLALVAKEAQATPTTFDSKLHPVRSEVTRLTRALGFLGDNFCGTGRAVEECQILQLLHQAGKELPLLKLRATLHIESTLLSRILSVLIKSKLLKKNAHPRDKRQIYICLSTAGERAWTDMISKSANFVMSTHKAFPVGKLKKYIELLQRFLPTEARSITMFQEGPHRMARIVSDHDRNLARAFLIESLVKWDCQYGAPEILVGADSQVFGLYKAHTLEGLLEVRRNSDYAILQNYAQAIALNDPKLILRFLLEGLRAALTSFQLSALKIQNTILDKVVPSLRQLQQGRLGVMKWKRLERELSS